MLHLDEEKKVDIKPIKKENDSDKEISMSKKGIKDRPEQPIKKDEKVNNEQKMVKKDIKVEKPKEKSKQISEQEKEVKYNGLHAYEIIFNQTQQYANKEVKCKCVVIARTEETAKNRIENEQPSWKLLHIKRIPDIQGYKIIEQQKKKAGICKDYLTVM